MAFSIGGALASTAETKVDTFVRARLAASKKTGWATVIVKLGGKLTAGQQKQLKELQADVYRHLDFIDSLAVSVPNRNLRKLAELPFVLRVSEDATLRKTDEFTYEHSGADVAFENFNLSGAGVTVAVMDSGIAPHDDLEDKRGASRVLASVSFVPNQPGATSDGFGHGTHVAGILAGNGADSTGRAYYRTFYGIARSASLVNVRVLDSTGMTSVSSAISGIQWIVANRNRYNIRVLNMSMGHPVGESYKTDPLCQAVEVAWKSGIVVVVSAGNDGRRNPTQSPTRKYDNDGYGTAYGTIGCPGNDPYVITVGAMRSMDGARAHDQIATYSSRGPSRLDYILKPDLVAPGNRIISLRTPQSFMETSSPSAIVATSSYKKWGDLLAPSSYMTLSGTSMAAPVVSGAAALMLQADPSLSPDTIKARMMVSADKWRDAFGNPDPLSYGAGYLNIEEALQSNVSVRDFALSPPLFRELSGRVKFRRRGGSSGFLGANQAMWGINRSEDAQAIWGSAAFDTSDEMQNAQAIWGNAVWDDNAVWGNGMVKIDLGIVVLKGD